MVLVRSASNCIAFLRSASCYSSSHILGNFMALLCRLRLLGLGLSQMLLHCALLTFGVLDFGGGSGTSNCKLLAILGDQVRFKYLSGFCCRLIEQLDLLDRVVALAVRIGNNNTPV